MQIKELSSDIEIKDSFNKINLSVDQKILEFED